MKAPFLTLLLAAGAWAQAPAPKALSLGHEAEIKRLQERMSASYTVRRLLAQTGKVARRERGGVPGGVRYFHGPPAVLAFDFKEYRDLESPEAELTLLRELARASYDLPLEMPEEEMALYQKEMEFILERVKTSAPFNQRLRSAYQAMEKNEAARRRLALRGRWRQGINEEPSLSLAPNNEVDRIAFYIFIFARDPDAFYWEIEHGLSYGPDAVRLRELEDIMERHGPDLGAVRVEPDALYARVKGRRYPPALVRAARSLLESGGLDRIVEAVGPFEEEGLRLQSEMKAKAADWMKGY